MDDDVKEALKVLYDIMGSDELVEALATMTWKMFTKLKEKGFTDEQAMTIVGRYSEIKK